MWLLVAESPIPAEGGFPRVRTGALAERGGGWGRARDPGCSCRCWKTGQLLREPARRFLGSSQLHPQERGVQHDNWKRRHGQTLAHPCSHSVTHSSQGGSDSVCRQTAGARAGHPHSARSALEGTHAPSEGTF